LLELFDEIQNNTTTEKCHINCVEEAFQENRYLFLGVKI